jgi:phosphoserine phosphatase
MNSIFLFDLDGTITCKELLPLIGREIGLYDELTKLTNDTMQGKIPFDQSFKYRVSLLSQVKLSDVQEIILGAPCFDELLSWIKRYRERSFIVTGNLDVWVQPWLDKHRITGFTSRSKLDGKSYSVESILKKETVMPKFKGSTTVMVGEGTNDARIMELADVAIATEMTHTVSPILWEHANYLVKEEDILCRLLTRLL